MLRLFWIFAKIGAFTLGGGFAMVPLMEREIVANHHWLTKEEFMDILILSQTSPGIFAVNMASHIGYKIYGKRGGLVGAAGVALPAILCILLIAMCFRQFKDIVYVEKFFMGLRPAVVALIVSPVFSMAKSAKLTLNTLWIPIVAAVLISFLGVSPVYIILAAGVGGFLYGRFMGGKEGRK